MRSYCLELWRNFLEELYAAHLTGVYLESVSNWQRQPVNSEGILRLLRKLQFKMDIVPLSYRVPGRKENSQLKKMSILLTECETIVLMGVGRIW